jgi:hypothetical protein
VYFRCSNSVCAEDIAMEAGPISRTIKRRQNPFAWQAARVERPAILDKVADIVTFDNWKLTDKNWRLDFLPNYVSLISEFTQRTFSFSQDKLKAIHGVLQTLDSSELAFPGGLPRAWLAETLLWQPREDSTYSIDTKAVGIPTWSWAAWSLSEGCVWTEYARRNAIAGDEPQATIHIQQDGGTASSYCVWTTYKTFFGKIKTNTPDPLSQNARQLLKSCGIMLSFETSVCKLRIGKAVHYTPGVPEDSLQEYYLLDSDLNRIGIVWTCGRIVRKGGKHQFIELSSRETGIAMEGAVADKYIPTTTDGEGNTTKKSSTSWKVINVMLVVWEGDVAFRIATGQVISGAWGGVTTRLIYLG